MNRNNTGVILFSAFLIALFGLVSISHPRTASAAVEPHPAGTLIKDGATIWRITDDGKGRQGFDSAEKFLSHRFRFGQFTFNKIVPANSADLALPNLGAMPWGDGVLFNQNGTIYQISGGQKHGFTSADIFIGLGFKFSDAISGNPNAPIGASINSFSDPHQPGTFVKRANTVWLITQNGRLGIPASEIFYSWGGDWNKVVAATAADMSLPEVGLLPYRVGTLVNENGAIWAIGNTSKRGFPSNECFTNFGFDFYSLIYGSTSWIAAGPPICATDTGTISAYEKKSLATSRGTFIADVMTINTAGGQVQVITDTAADADCKDNCPAVSLRDYVNSVGGFAGIHGTYFCPPDYSSCAGQTNSFFWKVYDTGIRKMMNANNGAGENDPFIAFDANGNPRWFSTYKQFRSSGFPIYAGINHKPALVVNGQNILDENDLDEKQKEVKSYRGALGIKGSTIYAVVARGATIPDLAAVMHALGVDYALNLDGGGSSAIYHQGAYKVGPGRLLPNAIIFKKI